MSEDSSFGDWVRRMLGWEVQEDLGEDDELLDDSGNLIKIPNRYKMCIQKSSSPQLQTQDQMDFLSSTNDPAGTITPSGHRLKSPERRRTSTHKRVIKKEKKPSVLRASVVSPEKQIIPPLTRLSVNEDMADKMSKILSKLDHMDEDDDEGKQ